MAPKLLSFVLKMFLLFILTQDVLILFLRMHVFYS